MKKIPLVSMSVEWKGHTLHIDDAALNYDP